MALLVGAAGACARQGFPPGGPEDQRPPVVVATSPQPFEVLEDLNAPVRFVFDERISERVSGGALENAITISPRGGPLTVNHGRRELTLRVGGGFRPGVVYRVTLHPVVSDLFQNQLAEAFELVFTTGGDATPTTLAGQIWDRVTGQGVPQVQVVAIGADSLVHQSTTDRGGIFAFRYLAEGEFTVTAFEDQNRNGEADSTETQGSVPATVAAGDTLLLDIPVLDPDTLPAVLASVEALDSVTLVIGFDDFLDPAESVQSITVTLASEGATAPEVEALFHEAEYAEYVERVTDSLARLDSIDRAAAPPPPPPPADTATTPEPPPPDSLAPPDSLVAGADTARVAERARAPIPLGTGARPQEEPSPGRPTPPTLDPAAGTRPGPMEGTGRVLPSRRIVALLSVPIERDVEYTVAVSEVVNINTLGGGGGLDTLFVPLPPPDTTQADTLAVPDTGSVQPDTGMVSRISPRELFRRR